ncbi:lytic transglycosylase domain-containing protein [Peptostreptococcus faecalis]|uniref:lytic transglycosylase domain-containing protein n=1 Tax=Peptostreptococcus faecalis TaxID=2045015 RepID=UPI002E8DF7ED|nr:lytic transglycosylase domain-containing protein [Peptostreptococcus faecalis]
MKNKRNIFAVIFLLVLIIIVSCINYKKIEKVFYPIKYSKYVEYYSRKYNIDKYLVYSVIKTESKFKEKATSNKGAKGLMQITDITAKWAAKELKLEKVDIYDPKTNIMIGTWYLGRLKKEFKEDFDLVIPAYNGGSGNVRKWLQSHNYSDDGKKLKDIPFRETSNYTRKVIENYKKYKEIYEK